MRFTKNRYMKRTGCIICTFLFLISILYSTVSYVYAKETSGIVTIEIQTKLSVGDGTDKYKVSSMPFVFELVSDEADAPLPLTKEVTINGEGKGAFVIPVNEQGTYKYQIHQITKEEKGLKLDKKKYDVTVYAKMDGQGKLVTWLVGTDHDTDKKVENFTFENSYTKETETPKPNTPENPRKPDYKKSGSMPKTGDATNITVYAGLGVLSAALLLLVYKRKREDKKNKKYEH